MIIKAYSPQNYNGTPDKILARKDKLVKDSKVKYNMFDGWVDYPIYKDLNELDPKDFTSYNKEGIIYIYQPNHTQSDDLGILKYKLIGATKKKSNKKILLMVEDLNPNVIFKTIYIEVNDDKVIDCGRVFDKTFDNWKDCILGDEYKGYRNSKWIRLNPDDFINLTGKIYSEIPHPY